MKIAGLLFALGSIVGATSVFAAPVAYDLRTIQQGYSPGPVRFGESGVRWVEVTATSTFSATPDIGRYDTGWGIDGSTSPGRGKIGPGEVLTFTSFEATPYKALLSSVSIQEYSDVAEQFDLLVDGVNVGRYTVNSSNDLDGPVVIDFTTPFTGRSFSFVGVGDTGPKTGIMVAGLTLDTSLAPVPLPATASALGAGLLGLTMLRRRKRRRAEKAAG